MIAHLEDRAAALMARVDPPRSRMASAGLPPQRRVPPLPVPRLHRPDQSGARAPLHPALPQVRRRTAVERLPAPHLPDRGAAHVPGARGRAPPASPACRAGGRAAPDAVARLPARTSAHVVAPDRGREGRRADRGADRQGRAAAQALPGRGRGAVPVLPHKLPVALDGWRATFVFAQDEDETESAVHTWGSQHAALWAALAAAGRAVEAIVVGRDPERLAAAERVLDKWASTPQESVTMAHEDAAAEMAAIKRRSLRTTRPPWRRTVD